MPHEASRAAGRRGTLDTSAAAITAAALLKLGHREQALALLDELVRTHVTADGRLLNGSYDLASGTATRQETSSSRTRSSALTGFIDLHEA
ncbi:hypothetical protein ABTZ93_41975 [Streptomyces sp. NPDC097941]|uniref:hypothetical protein n=1 Tax=Streptomyces sp. NPDC097941 TaxID=3155685 RepID=UPI0033223D70